MIMGKKAEKGESLKISEKARGIRGRAEKTDETGREEGKMPENSEKHDEKPIITEKPRKREGREECLHISPKIQAVSAFSLKNSVRRAKRKRIKENLPKSPINAEIFVKIAKTGKKGEEECVKA